MKNIKYLSIFIKTIILLLSVYNKSVNIVIDFLGIICLPVW